MRDIYPTKWYKDEGFVEYKIEIDQDDLETIIKEYLWSHSKEKFDFDFDEMELVNNQPMNIWLYAKCRRYIDSDLSEEEQEMEAHDAEVAIAGGYDGNE